MTYEELKEPLALFRLKESAMRREIKMRHRQLAKRYYPDANTEADHDMIGNINEAYGILMEHIGSSRYTFEENEFYDQNPDSRLRRQFMADPVGGGSHGRQE